jgi:hypothetical protein
MITHFDFIEALEAYLKDRNISELNVFGTDGRENKKLFTIFKYDDGPLELNYLGEEQKKLLLDDDFEKCFNQLPDNLQIYTLLYDIIKKENDKKLKTLSIEEEEDITTKDESVYQYQPLAKTWWETLITPFTLINQAAKWLTRFLILNSFLSRYTIGYIISQVANSFNPHYKTEPQTLTDTLKQLIFPAGSKKPQIDKDGNIQLDKMLTTHYDDFHLFHQQEQKQKNDLFNVKEFKVHVSEDTLVTGIIASNTLAQEHKSVKDTLHIIYFNGNSGCYQSNAKWILEDLDAYKKKEEVPVTGLMFNYPGVLNSTGEVHNVQQLIESGIAMVEYLHNEKGVAYANIGLNGVSLGSGIATHVANYYLNRGISLRGTFASKGFSSTTNVAVDYIERIPYIGWFLGLLARPWIAYGLWGSKWQLDTAAKYASLPENERSYSVVRSDAIAREEVQPEDDAVLGHGASLHRSWRLKISRFFHWLGWFGYDSTTYESTKNAHKMIVVEKLEKTAEEIKQKVDEVKLARPYICGHAQINDSYGCLGLFQRSSNQDNEQKVCYSTKDRKIMVGDDENTFMRKFFTRPKGKREGNQGETVEVIRKVMNMF